MENVVSQINESDRFKSFIHMLLRFLSDSTFNYRLIVAKYIEDSERMLKFRLGCNKNRRNLGNQMI